MPGPATDFRRIASALAAEGARIAEDAENVNIGGLAEMATAGKAALEAAAAAEIGPGEIVQALEHLADELEESLLAAHAEQMTVEEFLRAVFGEVTGLRKQVRSIDAMREAIKAIGGRLLFITQQAEAADNDTSRRVAASNRRALEAATVGLERAGISVPIEATRQ